MLALSFKNANYSIYKELIWLILGLLCIFIFNLILEYKHFLDFKESKHISIRDAKILQAYKKSTKKGKSYNVLKLKTKEFSFYTTSYKDFNLNINDLISLKAITTNVTFKDYLSKTFYMPSYYLDINSSKKEINNKLVSYFLNQHDNAKIKEFYGALFFAKNISLELRTDVNYYGIAHLIAISGYHIGLLFSVIFFILAPLYSFFQKRFFPYRNLRFDLSLIIFILLLAYAYLIGFTPSFIRSLIMAFWGFYLLIKNIKILSFVNLFMSICLCVALFPQLLFSVGFLFSILGVFYIFLYLHHFSRYFNTITNIILLNIWVFLAMILPVLYYFPLVSLQQFLAIILSAVFIVFYPLVLFLHIINLGFLLDNILIEFFNFKIYAINVKINFYVFISYILFSLLSIRFSYLGLFCVCLNFIPFILIFT